MKTKRYVKELCYELYKIDWKYSHNITNEIEMYSIKNYYNFLISENFDSTVYTFDDYIEHYGYNEELYVCYEEFLSNEYLEEDYIKDLLDDGELFEIYLKDLEEKNDVDNDIKNQHNDKDIVTIICYGKTEQLEREKAIEKYYEAMMYCEGSEKERYTNIYMDLMNGLDVCKDE